jgi:DNA polymerase beta
MNYKDIILKELEVFRKKEIIAGEKFKAIAYSKAINKIKEHTVIKSIDDMKGLGEGITKKVALIIETEQPQEPPEPVVDDAVHAFMNIYGVGRVKAIKLVHDKNMHSIEQLRQNTDLLNTNQKIGLDHYEDFLERIPRPEMTAHSRFIKKTIKSLKLNIDTDIVGSYRRGEKSSGDIDVLLKSSDPNDGLMVINKLKEVGYITSTLALGDKKFMGVCKIGDNKYRRLDILYTPEEQYGFALLYFTGSMKFNIAVRKIALEKGLSLNEHGFKAIKTQEIPVLKTEEEILNYLGIKMIDPKKRKDENIVSKNILS